MKVYTYIPTNNENISKEVELFLKEIRLNKEEADDILYQLNLKKNEINTFVDNVNERVEIALDEITENFNIIQSDIDEIIAMVGDL